jgi:hypothetical protein
MIKLKYEKEKIHFWNFPPEITINLEKTFRKRFLEQAIEYFGVSWKVEEFLKQKRKKYSIKKKSFASNLRYYKTSNRDDIYISQWVITELALVLNYNLKNMEKHIVSYRTQKGGSAIISPKLPISVSPEFDSILAHIICDGSDRITRKGHSNYTQKNIMGRTNFYKKLLNVFGGIYPCTLDLRREKAVGVPKTIISIIKNYYSINKVEETNLRIFLDKSKKHRLAILCSFLVDEGSIYDLISLRMKDKKMIEDMREITLSLSYKCSKKVNKFLDHTNGYVYGFNISNFSLKKMKKDIKSLSQEYHSCYLAHKQKHFEILALRSRAPIKIRKDGETKALIIDSLKKKSKNTMELSSSVGVGRRTASGHLNELKMENMVSVDYVKNTGAKIWKIKNEGYS